MLTMAICSGIRPIAKYIKFNLQHTHVTCNSVATHLCWAPYKVLVLTFASLSLVVDLQMQQVV